MYLCVRVYRRTSLISSSLLLPWSIGVLRLKTCLVPLQGFWFVFNWCSETPVDSVLCTPFHAKQRVLVQPYKYGLSLRVNIQFYREIFCVLDLSLKPPEYFAKISSMVGVAFSAFGNGYVSSWVTRLVASFFLETRSSRQKQPRKVDKTVGHYNLQTSDICHSVWCFLACMYLPPSPHNQNVTQGQFFSEI